jgi:hypothetical protein
MTTSQSRLEIVVASLNLASAELKRIQKDIGSLESKGKAAGLGLSKMTNPLQQLAQGNVSGGLQGIASALGPIGVGAGIVTVAALGMVKAYDAVLERGRALINTVDDLSDKFQISVREANEVSNFMKIMGVEASTLEMAFRTMARNGITPSLEGLRDVKVRLDAIQDPGQRTAETVKLLGRSGLELAETLGLSNDEFDRLLKLAKEAATVTDEMADSQDAYNRELASNRVIQEAMNIVATQSGRITKDSIVLRLSETSKYLSATRALNSLSLARSYETSTIEDMVRVVLAANTLQEIGIDVQGRSADEVLRLAASYEANSQALKDWMPNLYSAATAVSSIASAWASVPTTVRTTYDVKSDISKLQSDANELARQMHISIAAALTILTGNFYSGVGGLHVIPNVPTGFGTTPTGVGTRTGGVQQASGGLLASVALVGDQGEELVINGVVFPADITRKMKALGLVPNERRAIGGLVEDPWVYSNASYISPGSTTTVKGARNPGSSAASASMAASFTPAVAQVIAQASSQSAASSAAATAALVGAQLPQAVAQQTSQQNREQQRSNDNMVEEMALVRHEIRRLNRTLPIAIRDYVQKVL